MIRSSTLLFGIRRMACVLSLSAAVAGPSSADAQAGPAVLGAIGGFAAGTYTMVGVYVAEARLGRYLYSLEEALSPRLEMLPIVAGPVAGFALGLQDNDRLESAGLWGGVGFATGVAVGIPAGRLLWGSGEGVWAGGIIGGALGLVTGIVVGASLEDSDEPDVSRESGGFSVPIGISVSVP